MVNILQAVDVADMPLPKLENHLYFLNPKVELADGFASAGQIDHLSPV
jgi:hypothetical protein